jgi:CBS domain containing-hemolysin-like protein
MDWIVVLAALAVSAFFSGIEIAYLSGNKFKIELRARRGALSARILSWFVRHPSRFIGTVLVGVNVALVVYGNYMTRLTDPWLARWPAVHGSEVRLLLAQTVLATGILLIAGEFLPKMLFRINPNETLSFFAVPVLVFYVLFYPVVWLVLGLAHGVLRRAGIEKRERRPVFGRIDLDHYVQSLAVQGPAAGGILSEIEMFRAAMGFHRVRVRNCMVPRPDIVALEANEPVDKLRREFIRTGLSRILVYDGSLDQPIGFVHSFELFRRPAAIREILRPVPVVPETMPARELLRRFTQEHRSMAAVVDEHGLTTGLVTVEDVIEEIFGEIRDEHDRPPLVEKRTGPNEWLLSGRIEIDYLNQRYGLKLPTGPYETLAGFILHHHEHIPQKGEIIVIGGFFFKIERVAANQIVQVRLKYAAAGPGS